MDLFRNRDRKLNKITHNGGFTLVELIAVLAIISILAGVSARGLLGYTQNAAFRRNQANAETIFNAAQSALTYYKASGKLADFEKSLPDGHEVPSAVLPDSAQGRVIFLMLTKESGAQVDAIAGGEAGSGISREEEILINLLRDYVTEADIYKASICVEFDPADGIVYSVLYCDRAASLTYGSAGSNEVSIGTAADREESVRREKALGYYTSEMLSREPGKNESFDISEVELVNADTLDLIWSIESENQNAAKQMEYSIVLKNKSSDKKKAEIKMTPQNGVLALTEGEKSGSQITADVILYGADEADTKELSGLKFHAYLNEEGEVVLTLDAVDEGLTTAKTDAEIQNTYSARRFSLWDGATHYGLDLDDADPILAVVAASYGGKTAEKTSNSANMLFGEPVYETSGDESNALAVRTEANGEISYNYGIESMRHLYNARFRETDSHYTETEIVYEVRKNLAWGGTGESNTLKNAGSGESKTEAAYGLLSYTTASPEGGAESLNAGEFYTKYFKNCSSIEGSSTGDEASQHDPAFAGLSTLGVTGENGHTSTLTSVERENYALSGDGEEGGVVDASKSFTISNLALAAGSASQGSAAGGASGSSGEGSSAVGLVARNYGTISNLVLKDAEVRGITSGSAAAESDNVGAFCGINAGTLTNLKTEGGTVTGGENVGGILGRSIQAGVLSKLENDADVSGKAKVGGIIGAVGNDTAQSGGADQGGAEGSSGSGESDASSESRISIENCRNTGMVSGYQASDSQETSDPAKYIGGIAGYVYANGSIENCTSAPKLSEEDGGDVSYDTLLEKYGTADYVGGIAGYAADGNTEENIPRITGCKVEGNYVIGRDYVGGIVGWNGAKSDITNSFVGYASSDDGSFHVYGRDYTGGAVGYNHSVISSTTGISGNTAVQGRHFVGGFAGSTTSGLGDCKVSVESVKGELYVGGYVGGAFLTEDVTNIAPDAETFLPCKDVTGTAFVGGVLGFERSGSVTEEERADLIAYAEELQNTLASSDSQTIAASTALQNILAFHADGNASLTMGGTADNVIDFSQETKISGDLFVGGLFGYITENTGWTVQYINLEKISVSASRAVQAFGQLSESYGSDRTYSFAGGITGYITENTRVVSSSVSGTISSKGTYAGALAEVNEGMVENCSVQNFQASNTYVGGLVGLNGAAIHTCTSSKATVASESESSLAVTGGFAAENFGTVNSGDQAISINVSGKGSYAGGFVGRNTEAGSVTGGDLTGGTIAGSDTLGGIAGSNEGVITGAKVSGGTISGNFSTGGIAGQNAETGSISGCFVTGGTVQMSGNSESGSGSFEAPSAIGLLAGYNHGTLTFVSESIGSPTLTVAGADYAGSIAGVNTGVLGNANNNTLGDIIEFVYNISDESGSGSVGIALGGVAGQNSGWIYNVNFCGTLTGNGTGKYYGGIAGENAGEGVIVDSWAGGNSNGNSNTSKTLELKAGSSNALAGVVGYNTAAASLTGTENRAYGYRQGRSSGGTTPQKVSLQLVGGSGSDMTNSALGGMIGINDSTANLSNLTNTDQYTLTAVSGSGPVGGMIGLQKSGTSLTSLKNLASVSTSGEDSAGVIGDVQLSDGATITVSSCSNSANIGGTKNAAGIANVSKTGKESKVTFDACVNGTDGAANGKITNVTYGAGIVNFADAEEGTEVTVNNCRTYNVTQSCSYGAGIVNFAAINVGDQGAVTVSDCMNYWNGKAGKFTVSGSGHFAAGIVNLQAVNSGSVTVSGSQNRNGIESSSKGIFAGVVNVINGTKDSTAEVLVTDCVNAGPFNHSGVGVVSRAYVDKDYLPKMLTVDKCRNYGGCNYGIYAGYRSNGNINTDRNYESPDEVWIRYCVSMQRDVSPISTLGEDAYNFRRSSTGLGTRITDWKDGYIYGSWRQLPSYCRVGVDYSDGWVSNTACDNVDGYDTSRLLKNKNADFQGIRYICYHWPLDFDGNIVNTASLAADEDEISVASLDEELELEDDALTMEESTLDLEEETQDIEDNGTSDAGTAELTAPEVTADTTRIEYSMYETDELGYSDSDESTEVSLTHPSLTWVWGDHLVQTDGAEAEDNTETSDNAKDVKDAGYRIDVYALLSADTRADSDSYKNPTVTIDLLKNADGSGYHIERALTYEEETKWLQEHPGEALPAYIYQSRDAQQNTKLLNEIYKSDPSIRNVYEISLDSEIMGSDAYSYTLSQTVDGVGMRTISEVCPIIRVYEYQNDYTAVQLILPDVEAQEDFLYDETRLIKTQSVTIEALRQSRYEDQTEDYAVQKTQWIRLLNTRSLSVSGQEELLEIIRTLTPEDLFDLAFDSAKYDFADARDYIILPRNYGEEILTRSGNAENLAAYAQAQFAGENASASEDGAVFSDSTDTAESDGTSGVTIGSTDAAGNLVGFDDNGDASEGSVDAADSGENSETYENGTTDFTAASAVTSEAASAEASAIDWTGGSADE